MIIDRQIHVGVLMGGWSAEREVSLRSGRAAVNAIQSLGMKVTEVDVKNENLELPGDMDVAFLTLHGTGGEDGVVQKILEERGVMFTGSDSRSSGLAFSKVDAKKCFREAGLPVAGDQVLNKAEWKTGVPLNGVTLPCVVKPSREGSSVGIRIVKEEGELMDAVQNAFERDTQVLVEDFIAGREVTVGVLGNLALPIIEIRPKSGWYDYRNKYTVDATEYVIPAPLETAQEEYLQELALAAHRALGCRDLSRSDFRIDEAGNSYLLEVNTLPGMTETSLLPKAAAAAGIPFPKMCEQLVYWALARKKGKK